MKAKVHSVEIGGVECSRGRRGVRKVRLVVAVGAHPRPPESIFGMQRSAKPDEVAGRAGYSVREEDKFSRRPPVVLLPTQRRRPVTVSDVRHTRLSASHDGIH